MQLGSNFDGVRHELVCDVIHRCSHESVADVRLHADLRALPGNKNNDLSQQVYMQGSFRFMVLHGIVLKRRRVHNGQSARRLNQFLIGGHSKNHIRNPLKRLKHVSWLEPYSYL